MQSTLDFMITEEQKTTDKDRSVSGKEGVALDKNDVSMKENVSVFVKDGVALDKENVSVKGTVSVTDGVSMKDGVAIDVSISGKDGVACDVNVSTKEGVVLEKESVILGKDNISVNKGVLRKDNVSIPAKKDPFVVTTIIPFTFYHESYKELDKMFVDILKEEINKRVSSKKSPQGSFSLLDLLLCLPKDSPLLNPSYKFITPADYADPKLLASKTSIFPRFFRT